MASWKKNKVYETSYKSSICNSCNNLDGSRILWQIWLICQWNDSKMETLNL